jgi:hypothetical protein
MTPLYIGVSTPTVIGLRPLIAKKRGCNTAFLERFPNDIVRRLPKILSRITGRDND